MFSSSYFLCSVLLRGLAGMALEKACEVGLVREIQLLGYGCDGLVRIAQQHFHLGHQLLLDKLLGGTPLKALRSGPVQVPGRDA